MSKVLGVVFAFSEAHSCFYPPDGAHLLLMENVSSLQFDTVHLC